MTTYRPLITKLNLHVVQELDGSYDLEFRDQAGELIDPDIHTAMWNTIASRFATPGQLATTPYAGAVQTKTTAYTMLVTDALVISSGVTTITLPSAVTAGAGHKATVKREDATNATTVGSTAGTIDGASTASLGSNHATITVMSDGANWFSI
jgi:hypothetical protein